MVDNPDKIVFHQPYVCQGCGGDSLETLPGHTKRRQVFDLPPIKMEVTEHQAVSKCRLHCGCINKAEFPAGVTQPVQYGDNLEALCVYLH